MGGDLQDPDPFVVTKNYIDNPGGTVSWDTSGQVTVTYWGPPPP